MKKKAAIEIQFNWIFILIAGAIILIFFVMLATRQKETAETKVSIIVVSGLESILTGAKVSTGAATKVTLPVGNIKFDCDSYSVGDVPRKLKQMTVFTPNLIKGKEIVAWSFPWNVPFRVTNFLYLTSPQVRYIFVFDPKEKLPNQIYDALPEEMKKEKTQNPSGILDENNYKVKFVYFSPNSPGSVPAAIQNMPDNDVTAIKIIPSADPNTGTVSFYKKLKGNPNFIPQATNLPYYQDTTIFAAIFADFTDEDGEKMYECVMEKELKKLNMVAEVLQKRSEKLANEYKNMAPNHICIQFHNPVGGRGAKQILTNFLGIDTISKISNIKNLATELEGKNKQAEQKSCALIY